jgi:hypothetical protein
MSLLPSDVILNAVMDLFKAREILRFAQDDIQ